MKHALSKYIPYLPVVVWLLFAVSLLTWNTLKRPIVATETEVAPDYVVHPGFTATHNDQTGEWTWVYGKEMSNGCDTLVLADKTPVVVDAKEIVIFAKLHRFDGVCTQATRIYGLRGQVNYDADAVFKVILDGEQVIP